MQFLTSTKYIPIDALLQILLLLLLLLLLIQGSKTLIILIKIKSRNF